MTEPALDYDRVRHLRDSLPSALNAGILMGDGGFCILGWMLFAVGFHPITMYGNTLAVVEPARGGPAIDVVAREYCLPRAAVVELARLNDSTPTAERVEAVRVRLDELLTGGS
jgi:hypothetical protein